MNLNNILIICFILLVSTLIILYNTYNFKCSLETYHNYKKDDNKNIENFSLNNDKNNIIDFDELLIKKGYISYDSDELFDKLNFYISYIEFPYVSYENIIEKISEDIDKILIKINEDKLEGPIYVLKYNMPDYVKIYILYTNYYKDFSEKIIKKKDHKEYKYFQKLISKNILNNCTENDGQGFKSKCIDTYGYGTVYLLNNKNKLFDKRIY